jgi:predicted dithiol-disulfide oxidoreductase (DUF899 family)
MPEVIGELIVTADMFAKGKKSPVYFGPQLEKFLASNQKRTLRQLAFARERGWRNLHFYQIVGDDFARDYRGLNDAGREDPIVAVWQRAGTEVSLFWAAEGGAETADPSFDAHFASDPTPLWTILDWTPGGATNWYPKLNYGGNE